MRRCNVCDVLVKDDTEVCPLCGAVLEDGVEGVDHYPDVRMKNRRSQFLLNLYIFLTLVIQVLLMGLNYHMYPKMKWSLITFAAFIYGYLTLRWSIRKNIGYRARLIFQTIYAIAFIVLIDWVVGFQGWSLNYVLPSGILVLDAGIVIFMICNSRNWQSYILLEMLTILLSLIPMFLLMCGLITNAMVSIVALAVSMFLFLGTLIIGDRRARVELKRRFHVR